jgi:hypothetical protein
MQRLKHYPMARKALAASSTQLEEASTETPTPAIRVRKKVVR